MFWETVESLVIEIRVGADAAVGNFYLRMYLRRSLVNAIGHPVVSAPIILQ